MGTHYFTIQLKKNDCTEVVEYLIDVAKADNTITNNDGLTTQAISNSTNRFISAELEERCLEKQFQIIFKNRWLQFVFS